MSRCVSYFECACVSTSFLTLIDFDSDFPILCFFIFPTFLSAVLWCHCSTVVRAFDLIVHLFFNRFFYTAFYSATYLLIYLFAYLLIYSFVFSHLYL